MQNFRQRSVSIFFLLLIPIVALSGCVFYGNGDEDIVDDNDAETVERITGLIAAMPTLSGEATHVLTKDDGTNVLLLSLLVNLRKYEGVKTEVVGSFKDDVFFVEAATRLGIASSTKSLYKNVAFGFRLDYPSTWRVVEKSDDVEFMPYQASELEEADRVTVARRPNPEKLSPREWLGLNESLVPSGASQTYVYNESLVGLNQLVGIKETDTQNDRVSFYVSRDDTLYVLSHSTLGDEDSESYRNAFFDMVHSFQFVALGDDIEGAEIITAPEQENEVVSSSSEAGSHGAVRSYVLANIASLIGANSEVTPLALEFADPGFVYLVWQTDSGRGRTLFEYSVAGSNVYMEEKASFDSGEVQDWDLVGGEDAARGRARTIVDLTSDDEEGVEVEVKAGYELLPLKSLNLTIQYPRRWYWARYSDGVSFDTKPIDKPADGMLFLYRDDVINSGSGITSRNNIYMAEVEGFSTYCKKLDDKKYVCLTSATGDVDEEDIFYMLDSVVED
ncbi:MAG: hypothetical protein AAB592_04645 [Patescibacteria group bacterium]